MLTVFIIGFGDVGSNKLYPRLLEGINSDKTWKLLTNKEKVKLVVLDVKPPNTISEKLELAIKAGVKVDYISNSNGFTPIEIADIFKQNLTEDNFVITYIASPNKTHSKYIINTTPYSHLVLVEKPLVENLIEATEIEQKLTDKELAKVKMIDHYIFKDAVMYLIDYYDKFSENLGKLKHVEFYLLEKGPIRTSRAWLYESGLIRDLFPHFLSIMFKLKEKNREFLDIGKARITDVEKARYEDEAVPEQYRKNAKETFARIKLGIDDVYINVTIGKGVGNTRKQLIMKYENGSIILDTVINEIRVFKNNIITRIYRRRVEKNHEYKEITKNILNGNFNIGLDFWRAKRELELITETDKYPITGRYPLGKMPQP